ncbi:MAG: hypothetical protein HYU39_07440 [Thaumarchaeota archaeon]|nr:hypothetical protein [Nitrososphaerota archaeon]
MDASYSNRPPKTVAFISTLSVLWGGFLVFIGVLGAVSATFLKTVQPTVPYLIAVAIGTGALQVTAGFKLKSLRPIGFWIMVSAVVVNILFSTVGLITGVQETSGVILSFLVNGFIAVYLAVKRQLFRIRSNRSAI